MIQSFTVGGVTTKEGTVISSRPHFTEIFKSASILSQSLRKYHVARSKFWKSGHWRLILEAMGNKSQGVPSKEESSRADGDRVDGDPLSSLPESLLTTILSSLPTKDAVRTSVLAKRWLYLWTSIENLDFDDRAFDYPESRLRKATFLYFVDRVLLFSSAQTIKTFRLSCSQQYEPSRMRLWISVALRRNVQRLVISLPPYQADIELPRGILKGNSLRELKLSARCTFKPSLFNSMPNLTVLDLSLVTFVNESSGSRELSFSFPVLKELSTIGCKWVNVSLVKLKAPALTTIQMTNIQQGSSICAFEIDGASFYKFLSGGFYLEDIILSNPSQLTHAVFSILFAYLDDELYSEGQIARRAARLLAKFSNLAFLEVSGSIVQAFLSAAPTAAFPWLGNLTTLQLNGIIHCEPLFGILHIAPNLECLESTLGLGNRCDGHCDGSTERVPDCISKHLKRVQFTEFYGGAHDTALVKYFLSNALVLQKMSITLMQPEKSSEIMYKLAATPRGSTDAVVLLIV